VAVNDRGGEISRDDWKREKEVVNDWKVELERSLETEEV
jgi:hypothetical protein